MNQTHIQWIVGAVVVLVIIAGAFLFWKRTAPVTPVTQSATSTVATSTLSTSAGQATITTTAGGTVKTVPIANAPSAPEYKTAMVCAPDLNGPACTQLQSQLAAVILQISKQPTNGVAWINLGTIRKINLDYKGAEEAWLYVTKLYPTNPVAFANLGDLYMNFLHDYAKADANFLVAVKNDPADTSFYKDLFSLYTTTSYRSAVTATAAEDILKKGIAANPKAVDLQVVLARYYKSAGRTADAKAEYDAAIASAKSQGQTDLAAQIQAEAIQ